MRFLIILTAFLSTVFCFTVRAESFIEGMEDVPIAPNFVQAKADTISFGGVDSHFLEAVLVSEDENSIESYQQYYIETLPQFGWKLAKKQDLKLMFYRGEETLEITREYAKPLTLRINIYGGNQ